jgi:hypothetical protein
MPKNPARALQELHRQQMEQPPSGTATDTADNTASSTAVLTASSTHSQDDVQTAVHMPVSAGALEERRTPVRERIRTRATREPTVRITIDVPESLHGRLKEYCLTHRVDSLRGLTLALYEDFLSSEEA